MQHRMKYLWHHHRLALLAFATALSLAGFFGVKSVSQFIYWNDPQHQDQALAGWMTPRYIARSYDVPLEVVQEAFALAADVPPRRISLETLAAERGVTALALQSRLDRAVAAWRTENPRSAP